MSNDLLNNVNGKELFDDFGIDEFDDIFTCNNIIDDLVNVGTIDNLEVVNIGNNMDTLSDLTKMNMSTNNDNIYSSTDVEFNSIDNENTLGSSNIKMNNLHKKWINCLKFLKTV
ncbi:unnamed protein product [Brachionus calyciflorus]|uniref:Uncharacterized protein n=1 Tax=Brachionus calyciflorus TaxID=104777 RepID=A0A813VMK5_9BILA|nr:unnamed protein product [Brachionus calyciflorus]